MCLPLAKRARVTANEIQKGGPTIAYFLNTYLYFFFFFFFFALLVCTVQRVHVLRLGSLIFVFFFFLLLVYLAYCNVSHFLKYIYICDQLYIMVNDIFVIIDLD